MAPEHMSNDGYHCIGRGGCGSVWALDNALPSAPLSPQKPPCASVSSPPSFPRNQVLKRADGDPERSIANDLAMHQHLLNTTQNTYLDFLVPQSKMMLEANSPAYPRNFPPELQPCQTYVQERIPALPLSIRESLIARYCPERLREHVRKSKKDEDCLVRVYCGRRRSAAERARQKRFFTLRNHPLYIDQMEELGLDTDKLVGVLAKALATCYFTAHLDANDCEFVLGLPRRSNDNARQTVPGSLEGRSQGLEPREQQEAVFNMVDAKGGVGEDMAVWMLDFDCVRRISMDRKGFQQAAGAFWRNDPYFPRPWAHNYSTEDRRLWEVFVEGFLYECEVILERLIQSNRQSFVQLECLRRMRLAKLWVQDMELEGRKRKIEAWIDDVAEQTEIDL